MKLNPNRFDWSGTMICKKIAKALRIGPVAWDADASGWCIDLGKSGGFLFLARSNSVHVIELIDEQLNESGWEMWHYAGDRETPVAVNRDNAHRDIDVVCLTINWYVQRDAQEQAKRCLAKVGLHHEVGTI